MAAQSVGTRGPWKDVPAERRAIMRANRRRDSAPELALRAELHARGLRYRVDFPIRIPDSRPVRPDVVFTRQRVAVFVDGCFWHGCPVHGTQPTANASYWGPKIEENKARDQRHTRELESLGWKVIRIWEHVSPAEAADLVEHEVRRRDTTR